MSNFVFSRRNAGLSQLAAIIVVLLILVSGFTGYLIGTRSSSLAESNSAIITSTSTETTTTTISTTAFQTNATHPTESVTVTGTSYQTTQTVSGNNSISQIILANISTGDFPQDIRVNPNTNRVYVTFWNGSSYLAVIDGSTNKIVDTLPINSNALLVDSSTNI